MIKEYKILWVDDQHNDVEMKQFIIEAEGEGLILEGYASFEEAFDILERNLQRFDAILLDGMFFEKKGQSIGTEDELGIGMAIAKINQLKSKKAFPWFVLSGKEQFTKEKNSILAANKVRCFDKTNPKDVVNLFEEIKKESDQQVDTQIRHKYSRVFDVCTTKYIGTDAANDLLAILKEENSEQAFVDPKLYFNPLRKIMDDLFIACNNYGLMPDAFVKPSVALSESSKFLSGSVEKGYKLTNPVFPKVVSDHVRSILSVCQPASHRAEIDRFIALVNTPYLLLSVTYQLVDVLLWFKSYADLHTEVEINKANFKVMELGIVMSLVTGVLEQDEGRNYHCGDILLPYNHVNDMGYKIGDKIRIIKSAINTNERLMNLYKMIAKQSEKL